MSRRETRPRHRGRRAPLEWAADTVTRRPRLVIAIWVVLLAVLAARGAGLDEKVSTSPIFVDGSEPQLAHQIAEREFGSGSAMVVMLRGPEGALRRQGTALATRLEELPSTQVNSPWDSPRTIGGLNPKPGVAGLVVSVGAGDPASANLVETAERVVDRSVSSPVRASVAGGASLEDAVRDSSREAAEAGELIAIPVLLILLLLVFRSVIAAALPVVVGAAVVAGTRGVLEICASTVRIDSFALGAAAMLGLALGVDYSLLVVSRFREERERGDDLAATVRRTVAATGHSVIPAGCGLVLAMAVSSLVLPGSVILSVALAVSAAAILSVLSALFFTPAALTVLGANLDRWSLPRSQAESGRALRWTQRVAARPALVLGVTFVLFLCSAWAFALKTELGAVSELPAGSSARVQHEEIQRGLGPGWIAPLEVVMDADDGPVTTSPRLAALTSFQREVEGDPGVSTMAGFASLKRSSDQLAELGPGLEAQQRGITRIDTGLARARDGSAATVAGFSDAEGGARQIHAALGETYKGSSGIADGLESTAEGSEELSGGLERADEGSGKLAQGTTKSSNGAGRLSKALKRAQERASDSGDSTHLLDNALRSGEESLSGLDASVRTSKERLAAAQLALQRMAAGRSDPQYAAAVAAVEEAARNLNAGQDLDPEEEEPVGVQAGIERAQSQFDLGLYLSGQIAKNGRQSEHGIAKLAKAARQLDRGLRRLADSSHDVSGGIAKLARGGDELAPGLRKLTESAERLTGGLGEIGAGAGELAGGLGEGSAQSSQLTSALDRLHSGAGRLGGGSGQGPTAKLTAQSPGLFKSGYFFLAGIDGGKPERRDQAGFLINLGDGGSAARMLVIPRYDPTSGEAREARDRLRERAASLAREADAEVLVGGVTPAIVDVNDQLNAQAPLARLALSLVTILVLLFVTRSLVLPLLAAALNLLTVSATFGILALLFNGSLLGGPGFVDTLVVPGTIIVIFGLAIDYEVFIFARMREEYERTGSAQIAVTDGLRHSAKVVTGAALIMISVFIAFSLADVATIRVFGVALAVAVFIDAFLIRFVIVPATMNALGDRSWWLPGWLDRLLPGGGSPALRLEEG